MLHAVAVRPRQVHAQERVGVGLELRQLAEDRDRFADDALDVLGERVGFGFGAVVRQRDAERRRRPGRFWPSSTVNVRSMKSLKSVGLSIR